MSIPLRSKLGCWTCRLRKKKCDEERPLCSVCTSLSISCYGYGPKPGWMNDPEQERAVANSLKEIVKHTSRHKTTRQSSKQRTSALIIAPKPLDGWAVSSSISGSEASRNPITTHDMNHQSSREEGGHMLRGGPRVSMLIFYQSG
jgi:hypothetical protein